jgi:hypothetical protein
VSYATNSAVFHPERPTPPVPPGSRSVPRDQKDSGGRARVGRRHYRAVASPGGRAASPPPGDFVSERPPARSGMGRPVKELTVNTYALEQGTSQYGGQANRFRPRSCGVPAFPVHTEHQEEPPDLPGFHAQFVHTSSEHSPGQRETIERVLSCPVRDWYSHPST